MAAITIDSLERIAEALGAIDSQEHNYRITKSEFDRVVGDAALMAALLGKHTHGISWGQFREQLPPYQAELGLHWRRGQGQGGTLRLDLAEPPGEVGYELALELHAKGVKEGGFRAELTKRMPHLFAYLDNVHSHNIRFTITKARRGFSADLKGDCRFKFSRKGDYFRLGTLTYRYSRKGDGRAELELGELIRDKIEALLELNRLDHKQQERKRKRYQNCDLEGFKVVAGLDRDEVHIYSFELKATNDVSAISEAISQAINYKDESNFTYIVIPKFDLRPEFHTYGSRFSSSLVLQGIRWSFV